MKLIVALCVLAVATAAPPASVSQSKEAQILKFENEQDPSGNYKYAWETNDGIRADATGEFHPGNGKDNEGYIEVRGSYEYVGSDGVTYTVNYVADENGFRPALAQGPNGVIPDEVIKNLPKP